MDFKMLLEKCQIWNEDGNYAKIIEELEKIPYENRTPETDSELARAYANIAEPSDREPVSYTHLDVYKRQILYNQIRFDALNRSHLLFLLLFLQLLLKDSCKFQLRLTEMQ